MSYSSLWGIDTAFYGHPDTVFDNSWIFGPPALDCLMWRYLPGTEDSCYISASIWTPEIPKALNKNINESEEQADRVVWELVNQQVFYAKDKDFVAAQIRKFAELHKERMRDHFMGFRRRAEEMAGAIEKLNACQYLYFAHKNTDVDDNVENWFSRYDPELEEGVPAPLSECEHRATEFVVVKDGKITGFIPNLEFDYALHRA